MKLKTGDQILVIRGKDRGKKGKILQAFPLWGRVSVEGVNVLSKHIRPQKRGQKGQKVSFPAPISAANVQLVCPKCQKTTRIQAKMVEGKKTGRMCKLCQEIV